MPTHTIETDRQDQSSLELLRRLYRDYVWAERRRIFFATILMLSIAGATIVFAMLIEPILDEVFHKKNFDLMYPIAFAAVAVGFIRGMSVYGQRILMARASMNVMRRIQKEMFAHLMRADLAFFQQQSTGHLISRMTSDVGLMRASFAQTFVGIFRYSITLIGLLGVMIYQDWFLSIVAGFGFPIAWWLTVAIGRRTRRLSHKRQGTVARFTTLMDEAFRGARHVKAYGMEAHESERAKENLNELLVQDMKLQRTRAIAYPVLETLSGLAIGFVIIYGGSQVMDGTRTTGAFFSFLVALAMCYDPLKRLSETNARLQAGLAAVQRVFAILDVELDIADRPGAKPLKFDAGHIRFTNVGFSYGRDAVTLHDVTLDIPAGARVAIVGPSGAGKTTMLNLIPRFYDVNKGSITVDGQDVRDVTLASLREAIGLVSQDVSLFDDTVRANIAYGSPGIDDEAIKSAARSAGAHDFIMALPKGYDTEVGGRGESLSGGQRQRIAIARAMLKNAPILLLDEATSSLDMTTERQVQEALATLMAGRTTVIVAHRLSTIVDADLIYVMDEGHIVESGNHEELLRRGDLYARLYALQGADALSAERERA